ncbi:MAG: outer membrane beta-barrel domain-containing protein [Cytophagales bacterium]|nr:outer membrane beta-barrel domain-containing protein [Rhizobacter sp.]
MHTKPFVHLLLTGALLAVTLAANAADEKDTKDQKPANEQVIVPQVDRRDVRVPKIPSNDFEIGLFAGTYATQNFGSSSVSGVRLGYHITEDFFVEGTYGRAKVTDEAFRQILPGGIFATQEEKLKYYNLSIGINVLPGEVFLWRNYARPSAFYIIGGIGNTDFNKQRKQTFNFGFGARVFLSNWASLQMDVRDHMYELDLLGKRQNTQNIEMTVGATFFF